MAALQIRMPDEQLDRWREVASRSGMTLAQFVRSAVEARIEDRTSKAIASAVARELLPEIERMLVPGVAGQTPVGELPRAFERGCTDADLHTPGRHCPSCGGSFH